MVMVPSGLGVTAPVGPMSRSVPLLSLKFPVIVLLFSTPLGR